MSTTSKEERHPWHEDVQGALAEVGRLIEDVVRREQHRNDLTGLPNERALDRKIDEALDRGNDIWCAFIEVDHFKRINSTYKYAGGNAMLKKIGQVLQFSLDTFFLGQTTAFHAHGDEFYLMGDGPVDPTKIADALDAVRKAIAAITLQVKGIAQPMRTTVTIGWAIPADMQENDATRVGFKQSLEDAVSAGKRQGRNRTLRYSKEMRAEDLLSERGTCEICEAAFTMDVDKAKLSDAPILWCPNCGATQNRPERPSGEPVQLDA
jgi:diguanylate cyclase (GGDEF)-like protein